MLAALSDIASGAATVLAAAIVGIAGPVIQARVSARKAPSDADEQAEIDTERSARQEANAAVNGRIDSEARRTDKVTDAVVWLHDQFLKHGHG